MGTKVFHTNLGFSTDQMRVVNELPKFYQDLLNLFTKFSSIPEETMPLTNTLDQHLWNNKYVTKNNEPVYHQTFLELGWNTIHYLLDENGQLGKWNFISNKFGLRPCDFLTWYGLINSIPKDWIIQVREGQLVQENPEGITYLFIDKNSETLKSVTSGKIYNSLIKDRISEPTSQRYFERTFNKTEIDWSQIYLLPWKVSVETRIRAFQFKIQHNILYLNQKLHKMGLAEFPLCNLCGISQETTTHLFLNFPITSNLWWTIQRKCSPSLTLPDITVSMVHLGFFSEPSDQNTMIKNQVLLSFKQFIYKHRADSPNVNFEKFLRYLMLIQKIESKIPKDKERLEVHWKKWDILLQFSDISQT